MAVLVQIDGWDPVDGAAVALRAASDDDVRICMLDGQTWWPVVAKLPQLRYDLFSGRFDGAIGTPGATLSLGVEPWPNFARLMLADARVRLWQAAAGTAWPWTLLFDGRATAQPSIAGGVATLSIAVDDRWLDAPLLAVYAGTGGAEGHAGLKGAVKPLAIGAPRYQAGVLIDPANTVVQLSNGAIADVEAALERLARFGASAGNYASYAALAAASIPPGAWATARAVGMVRHGAPPVPGGKLSYLVQGDNGGTGGWVRRPGAIIRRLCEIAGQSGKVDVASMAALDTARPWNLSIAIEAQTSLRSVIQRVAASVNAVAGVSWTGKLFAAPVAIGASAAIELRADGTALPAVARVEQQEAGPPVWRDVITAERAWNPHGLDEIAFTAQLIDLGAYSGSTVYREGNIVQFGGGSWVYINPTPSAGNPPPSSGTSNTWWRALAVASGLRVQGSTSESGPWHDGLEAGDLYMRTSDDGGATFGPAVRIAGEGGTDGPYVQFVFRRSASAPATPSGDNIPAGWADGVPAGSDPLWMSKATQIAGVTQGSWSVPARITGDPGQPGADAFIINTTGPATVVIPCDAAGNPKVSVGTATSGTATLWTGSTQVTSGVEWFIGLPTASSGQGVDVSSGAYTLATAFSSAGTLKTQIELIAKIFGVEVARKKMEATKANDGAQGPAGPAGPSGIPRNYSLNGSGNWGAESTVFISDWFIVPTGIRLSAQGNVQYTTSASYNVRTALKIYVEWQDNPGSFGPPFANELGTNARYDSADNATYTGNVTASGSTLNSTGGNRTGRVYVNLAQTASADINYLGSLLVGLGA